MYIPAVGPLCQFMSTTAASDLLSDCSSTLADYEAALTAPDPACGADSTTNIVTWTPNNTTPDLVYYQVCVYISLLFTCTYVCIIMCMITHPSLSYLLYSVPLTSTSAGKSKWRVWPQVREVTLKVSRIPFSLCTSYKSFFMLQCSMGKKLFQCFH